MLSIFSSCKDKEVAVDKCSNGFVDGGETGVDCGGNCTPCIPYEAASIYLECNGVSVPISNKTLTYQNNVWILNANNDTISFQFNLGTIGNVGTYSMNPNGSYASKNGNYYLNCSDATYAISDHNLSTNKMSGFFEANFSRTGFSDTLKVRSGQFSYLPY